MGTDEWVWDSHEPEAFFVCLAPRLQLVTPGICHYQKDTGTGNHGQDNHSEGVGVQPQDTEIRKVL